MLLVPQLAISFARNNLALSAKLDELFRMVGLDERWLNLDRTHRIFFVILE